MCMVYTLSYSVVRTNVCMQQAKRDAESDMLSHFLDELDVPTSTSATPTPPATTGTDAEAKVEEQPQQVAGDDDLMADFFSSISSVKTTALDMAKEISTSTNSSTGIEGMDRKNGNLVNEKYVNQELGTATEQADRLTQPNYLWRNLNPYYVLQLDIDATEEDIKQRYRKLSTRVHPDKLRGREDAREAFEQVKLFCLITCICNVF
jgi:DnaJ-domain-containing protein 1